MWTMMRMMTVLSAVLLVLFMQTVTGRSCSSGWRQYGQRCFRYVERSRTWAEAEMYCLVQGANLASVHSSEEYHFLQRMTTRYAWIGGYDAAQENLWFWTDGSRMSYRNWARGQPDNYKGQHCMAMNYGGGLRWDDSWCDRRYRSVFICAKRI